MKSTVAAAISAQKSARGCRRRKQIRTKNPVQDQPPSVPDKETEQRRTSSRQRSGTRKVICTSKSGTRIQGREEAATLPKDTIPRP